MKKIVVALTIGVLPVFANFSEYSIAESLKRVASQKEIDPRVLYTIAKIESNFEPLIISFTSYSKDFNFENAVTKTGKYKDKFTVSITADKFRLQEILEYLIDRGFSVDAGLMQVNSINFSKHEIPYIFELEYNIHKSTKVLEGCIQQYKTMRDSIECYNKGFKRKITYGYWDRFKNNFMTDFGGL